MSQINEVITEAVNRAFNAGKEHGKLVERQRIIEIARSIAHFEHQDHEWLSLSDLMEHVYEQNN